MAAPIDPILHPSDTKITKVESDPFAQSLNPPLNPPSKTPLVLPSNPPSDPSVSSNSTPESPTESQENLDQYHKYREQQKKLKKGKVKLVYIYGDDEKRVDLTGAACSMKIVSHETKNEGKRDMYTVTFLFLCIFFV